MPYNIVWKTVNAIARPLGHLRKAFCLSLVLKCIAREVDARTVDICFYNDVDATDAVKGYFFVFVGAPVAHLGHVLAFRGVLFVAYQDVLVGEKGEI